jgi:hypothetical protein
VQGADERAALAVETVGQDDAEMEALGEQFLDDLDGQLRLGLIDIARLEARFWLEDAEEQREGGGTQHPIGVDGDDAVGQRVQIADVLAGDIVGRVAFLPVPRLVDAEDEGRAAQSVAQQLQPLRAQRLHRPVGIGEEVVQGLGVGMDGLAQARQRLVPGLGEQTEVEGRELLEVPDVMKQRSILGTILVDEGHRRGG